MCEQIEEISSKELNILCRNLGHRVINAINNVSVITPHALVAAAAMNCSKKSFTYDHFLSHVETYMNYLSLQGAKLADTLLIDHIHAIEHAYDSYIQRKFIECITKDRDDPLSDSLYKVNESKRPHLEYYKNNCISFFIPGAIAALTILVRDAFQFSASDLHDSYEFLQYFFKYEFAYDVDITVCLSVFPAGLLFPGGRGCTAGLPASVSALRPCCLKRGRHFPVCA